MSQRPRPKIRPKPDAVVERRHQVVGSALPRDADGLLDVADGFGRAVSAMRDVRERGEHARAIGAARARDNERFTEHAIGVREIPRASQRGTELAPEDQDSAQRVVQLAS